MPRRRTVLRAGIVRPYGATRPARGDRARADVGHRVSLRRIDRGRRAERAVRITVSRASCGGHRDCCGRSPCRGDPGDLAAADGRRAGPRSPFRSKSEEKKDPVRHLDGRRQRGEARRREMRPAASRLPSRPPRTGRGPRRRRGRRPVVRLRRPPKRAPSRLRCGRGRLTFRSRSRAALPMRARNSGARPALGRDHPGMRGPAKRRCRRSRPRRGRAATIARARLDSIKRAFENRV